MLSRTQLRRRQRQYAFTCYQAGAKQRLHHGAELSAVVEFVRSAEARTLLESVGIHRADVQALQLPVHHASVANLLAQEHGLKNTTTFKQHRSLHQGANQVKHNFEVPLLPSSPIALLGPPPPPPPSVLMCHELPEQLMADFVPFTGTAWNLKAPAFEPILNRCSWIDAWEPSFQLSSKNLWTWFSQS